MVMAANKGGTGSLQVKYGIDGHEARVSHEGEDLYIFVLRGAPLVIQDITLASEQRTANSERWTDI